MPPHDAKLASTRDWLEKATGDLEVAQELARKGLRFSVFVLFHSQQAVEKALKAFLFFHGLPLRRVHDIGALGEACRSKSSELADLAVRADFLTPHAVTTRYPGEDADPKAPEVSLGLRIAKSILKEVLTHLPVDAHPKRFAAVSKKQRKKPAQKKSRQLKV